LLTFPFHLEHVTTLLCETYVKNTSDFSSMHPLNLLPSCSVYDTLHQVCDKFTFIIVSLFYFITLSFNVKDSWWVL